MARIALRRQLLIVAVAGVLPLAVLAGGGILYLFQQQRDDEQRRALEITRALASAVDADLKRSVAALQMLAAEAPGEGAELNAFERRARRAAASQPYWRSVNLAKASGEMLVNTRAARGDGPEIIERESFDAAVMSGRPLVGSLALGPHAYAVPVRVPVVVEGAVRYVATAVVDPTSILRIIRDQKVPDDWVISVFDSRGARVARSRAHDEALGKPASPGLQRMMERGGSEGVGVTPTLEGDSTFTAYVRLPDSGWSVATGLPVTAADRRAAQSIVVYVVAVIGSILIGLGFAFVVARRINEPMAKLGAAAHTVGAGGVPAIPASDIREIDEVGEAMVAAARQRRAHEAELENANRSKDQFLAMLAHELRNPLAALSNAATVLSHGSAAPPEVLKRAGEVIQRQVTHLARLTDDLLDTARALLGKIELRDEPVDLARIASQVLNTFHGSGKLRQHRVTEELRETWVMGDPIRLDQIVSNLLGNAVKFTPAGGSIDIRTARAGGESILAVRDNGIGLSPQLAARAFDLFVQGDRALDRAQGGLGIGLTLVRRLAELHRGTVTVTSAGESSGSEFVVRLPAIDRPERPAAVDEAGAGRPLSVLVIEDNDDARETLTVLLRTMGHRVEAAADGQEGLDKALANPPDIALVDLGMPRLDGFEVARRLRSRGLRSFLVALTGYGSQGDRDRALEAGFDAHVTKPIDYAELSRLLARSAATA